MNLEDSVQTVLYIYLFIWSRYYKCGCFRVSDIIYTFASK